LSPANVRLVEVEIDVQRDVPFVVKPFSSLGLSSEAFTSRPFSSTTVRVNLSIFCDKAFQIFFSGRYFIDVEAISRRGSRQGRGRG
jgi:hypothetical protein